MADVESFVHDETAQDRVVHYRFETIHPFLDGKGRIGRLMITLYLVSKRHPQATSAVLVRFLRTKPRALLRQPDARAAKERSRAVVQVLPGWSRRNGKKRHRDFRQHPQAAEEQKKVEGQFQTLGSRAAKAHEALYRDPIVDAARVAKIAKLSPASAYKLIGDLERLGVLKEITGGKRGRTWTFEPYVKLFR